MPRYRLIGLAAAFAASFAGASMAQDADTVLATVGETEIRLGHMLALFNRMPERVQQLPAQTVWDGLLEQLVQQAAMSESLDSLSRGGVFTNENNLRAVRAAEVIDTAMAGVVTDAAIQAAYDASFANAPQGLEYNASHILLDSEEAANAVLADIRGGADFQDMAREHSTGPSGPSGGALGWFGLGQMVPAFETAVVGMDPGTVAGPVQTQFGWHLIMLNEVREIAAPALETVRDQLVADLQDGAVAEMLAAVLDDTTIVMSDVAIDPELMKDQSLLAD